MAVGGVGERLLHALRQGLCAVGGVLCPPPPQPCVVKRDAQRDNGSVSVGVVRLGEDQALIVERLSNGKVAVTLIGGGHAGAEVGIGAGGSIGTGGDALGAGAEARAAVIARLGDGREWILPDEAAAKRLIDQLGRDETIPLLDGPAEAIDDLFGGGEDVRRPDVEWDEGGTGGDATGEADLGPATVSARVAMGVSVGIRTDHRTGRRTYYLRLDAASSAALSAKLLGASGAGAGADLGGRDLRPPRQAGRAAGHRIAPARGRAAAAAGPGRGEAAGPGSGARRHRGRGWRWKGGSISLRPPTPRRRSACSTRSAIRTTRAASAAPWPEWASGWSTVPASMRACTG